MPNIHSQVKVLELSNYREIFPYSSLYRAHDLKEYPLYNINFKKKKKKHCGQLRSLHFFITVYFLPLSKKTYACFSYGKFLHCFFQGYLSILFSSKTGISFISILLILFLFLCLYFLFF